MNQSFTPVRVGRYTLPNRLVMAPMTRSRAKFDGTPGELAAEYYAQRASVGLIVTEGTQLLVPGLASIGALWLGFTMVCAVATHVFVLHTSPVPAIVLGVLNAVVVYLRRDELVALLRVKG
jgi:putative oxidoreductase